MDWDLLPTPNPNEDAIRIWVDKGTALGMQGRYSAGETTLTQFELSSSPVSEGQDDWIYVEKVGPDNTGRMGFIFAKAKTEEEKYTAFEVTPSSKPFGWHTVIKRLEPIPDFGTPRSGVKLINGQAGNFNAPEYYAQVDLIDGGDYVTRFLKYEYQAPTKFDIPAHDGPVPLPVMVMLPGREAIYIPKALHKQITIDRLITSVTQGFEGSYQGSMSSIPGQVFPSTAPFEEWAPWVVEHDQKQVNGVWYCWKVIAFPPPEPELIRQLHR